MSSTTISEPAFIDTYNEYVVFSKNLVYRQFCSIGNSLTYTSKYGLALATIQVFFRDQDIHTQNAPLIVETEGKFKILFPMETDKKRPICFLLTNLCHQGRVKIDISYVSVPDMVTDPPQNINRVNELGPFITYNIVSNQLDNYEQLMIDSSSMTIPTDLPKETFYEFDTESQLYISVTPSKEPELNKLFKDGYWSTNKSIIVENKWEFISPLGKGELTDMVAGIMPVTRNNEEIYIDMSNGIKIDPYMLAHGFHVDTDDVPFDKDRYTDGLEELRPFSDNSLFTNGTSTSITTEAALLHSSKKLLIDDKKLLHNSISSGGDAIIQTGFKTHETYDYDVRTCVKVDVSVVTNYIKPDTKQMKFEYNDFRRIIANCCIAKFSK